MGTFKGLQDALQSYHKNGPKKGRQVTDTEKRLMVAFTASVLVVVALALIFIRADAATTGMHACTSIILQTQRNQCLGALANRTENYSACTYIHPQYDSYSCIAAVAAYRRNASICSHIDPYYSQHTLCIDEISNATGDIGYCSSLGGANASDCAYGVASARMFANLSQCGRISDQLKSGICTGAHYYNLAISSNDPYYCGAIPNTSNASNEALLGILANEEPSNTFGPYGYVSYGELSITPQGLCYYRIATSLKEESLCQSAGAMSSLCYSNITSANAQGAGSSAQANSTINNYSVSNLTAACSSVANVTGICSYAIYTEKALSERNASECMLIGPESLQDSCIVELATYYNSTSYCSAIKGNASTRQACITSATVGALGANGLH